VGIQYFVSGLIGKSKLVPACNVRECKVCKIFILKIRENKDILLSELRAQRLLIVVVRSVVVCNFADGVFPGQGVFRKQAS
jgi:hypothetical protein